MPSARLAILARSLLVLPPAACTVGDITGPGGGDDVGVGDDDPGLAPDAAPTPDYAVSIAPPSIDTTLGTESRYTITLSSDHFDGDVTLSATGVPAGWTATFEPSTVTLADGGTGAATLVVVVPSDAAAAAATIGVDAQAAPGLRQASAALTVANEYVVDLAAGTGSGAHAFPPNLTLKLGATVRVRNSDTTPHRVHSDGGAGFPHQETSMAQGESYLATPGDVGGYRFYCHDHGDGLGATALTVVP